MLNLLKRFLYTLPLVIIGWLGSMPGHATESSAVAIAAGNSYTCALTTAGGAKCWGWNLNGQLGDNSNTKETLNNSQHSRVRRLVSECGVKFCDFCPELRHFLHYSPVFRI